MKGDEEHDENERERMYKMVASSYMGVLSESNYALLPIKFFLFGKDVGAFLNFEF